MNAEGFKGGTSSGRVRPGHKGRPEERKKFAPPLWRNRRSWPKNTGDGQAAMRASKIGSSIIFSLYHFPGAILGAGDT